MLVAARWLQSRAVDCLTGEVSVLCSLSYLLLFVDCIIILSSCLQCFDAVGWAAGRASGL